MKSLITYNNREKSLLGDVEQIPLFCQNCIGDKSKKCEKYYDELVNNTKIGIHKCPYGFVSIKTEDNIYTCLIIDKNNKNAIEKLKYYNQKPSNFNIYNEKQLLSIISDFEELIKDNNQFRDCMHDLNNIGTYFNSMATKIETKYAELCENDNDIKAMLCLYDMMNYRLSIATSITELGYRKQTLKLHPMLEKLKILLSYKAKNKDIKIILNPNDDYIIGSNNLYIAMFIVFDNAVKYSPSNKEIDIFFEKKSENKITVNVSNYGPKILEGEKEKLTDRGYRGVNSTVTGQGIGLSIFKEICKKGNYPYEIKIISLNQFQDMFVVSIELPTTNVQT